MSQQINNEKFANAIEKTYSHIGNFILLGLTGRTGSGCSTAAQILGKSDATISLDSVIYTSDNDKRKLKIISNFTKENWEPFYSIRVTTVITYFILDLNFNELTQLLSSVLPLIKTEDLTQKFSPFKEEFEKKHLLLQELKAMPEDTKENIKARAEKSLEIFFDELPAFTESLKTNLQDLIGVDSYVLLYQEAGDNIRASGKANIKEFDEEKIFFLPRVINKIVRALQYKHKDENKKNLFIVIDAIRNPYEAEYFRQRHAHFFLVAVNTPNSERLAHLRESHKLSDTQIHKLDQKEYPKKSSGNEMFVSQNIQRCIELADIHITNPKRQKFNHTELANQLYWYVTLIKHPGLITPTAVERSMQLAYTAKLNSGCISRQVGAVVTDSSFSVKAVGWNSVPEGQVPCLLRGVDELMHGVSDTSTFSEYEQNNSDFRKVIQQSFSQAITHPKLKGRSFPYCFKDAYNEVEGDKNQVHTRSLHAEENAFLQITKYGGGGIKGGMLFTTASPCELCSKKAYQLGIKGIYYIDPYPGISNDHILKVGDCNPELILFSGAIGAAYHKMYQPIMSYKDELQVITGFKLTGGKGRKYSLKTNRENELEFEVEQLKEELKKFKK
jgi:deoxycytidylate deaminase